MKKFLFALIVIIASLTASAQVTVTIDNVTPTTVGKNKGDLITYTVSAPTEVWGTGFDVTFSNGEKDGAGSLWNPHVLSYKTTTSTFFVGLYPNYLHFDRTYTFTVMTDLGDFTCEPYTVTAK